MSIITYHILKMKKSIKMESEILKREINEGHYLELMDRLYVLASTLHDHCLQHPLAEYDEEIYNSIEIALEATYDAYQLVGSKEYENEDENNAH